MEFTLIHDLKLRPFLSRWEKKLIIPLVLTIILVTIYFQNKDGSGIRFLLMSSFPIFIHLLFQLLLKKQNHSVIYIIRINKDILSVYKGNNNVWKTPVNEITRVHFQEPITILGIRIRNKALIINKKNDSIYFSLESARFKEHTVYETIGYIKNIIKDKK